MRDMGKLAVALPAPQRENPMPFAMPLAQDRPAPAPRSEARQDPLALVATVAAIVAIAAQRARASGTVDALRDAVEAALDSVAGPARDPRDAGRGALPRIADADPALEETRLRGLIARMPPR